MDSLNDVSKRASGGWNQMYPEAVKDFPTHEDFSKFLKQLELWMTSLNVELAQIKKDISTHTHYILPQTITNTGEVIITNTYTGVLTVTPYSSTGPAVESLKIRRPSLALYKIPYFINTTTVPPNIKGTVGYTFRPTATTPPIVESYINPISLVSGV